jgi:membrane-associated phospholipid phosphatase
MIFTSGVADMNFLHGVREQILENGLLANPFAAMPSLHFGYALFIGIMLYVLASGRWARWFGFIYTCVVLVTIVATGNHYIIDAVAGALVVLAAWAFAVNVQPAEAPQPSAATARERDG